MSDACAFCGDGRVVEQHHIVPRRYDGGDGDENLVTVCPTCHAVLEDLYDKRFYQQINARVKDRDAYEQGVKDTLEVISDARSRSYDYLNMPSKELQRHAVNMALKDIRKSGINELLGRYEVCPACEKPVKRVDQCPHCGMRNLTTAES